MGVAVAVGSSPSDCIARFEVGVAVAVGGSPSDCTSSGLVVIVAVDGDGVDNKRRFEHVRAALGT